MVLALAATNYAIAQPGAGTNFDWTSAALLYGAIAIGAVIGTWKARRVEMTGMPELIALLHSFVGAAAVLVGFNVHLTATHTDVLHAVEVVLGIFIGAVTLTGSLVAWGKLNGSIASKPLMLPGRNWINLGMLVAVAGLGWWYVATLSLVPLLLVTLISLALGCHLVAAIGGADMPVVVSMLNSYSGWAAAFSGFMLDQSVLIITGALVGASGAILSYIMCRAMNRSFVAVILGGCPRGGQRRGRGTPGGQYRRGRETSDRGPFRRDRTRIRDGGGPGSVSRGRADRATTGAGCECAVCDPSRCGTAARSHERAAG